MRQPRYRLRDAGMYAPKRGSMTERIERHLSRTEWRTARQVSDLARVPRVRTRNHLYHHWRVTGRLEREV